MGLNNVITEKIGDGIEILIEGLSHASVTPDIRANAALAMVRNGIPLAGVIGVGILGGIKTATLKINGQILELKYCIKVQKVMTALQIYDEAIHWIQYQKKERGVDAELADEAIEYLRKEFKQEINK